MTTAANKPDLPQTVFGMNRPSQEGTLLFFPDFGGNNLYARPLVAQLSKEISCYGLRFSADMIKSFDDLSIEDIARQFAKDIISVNLTRPIHLLGYSFAASGLNWARLRRRWRPRRALHRRWSWHASV